MQTIIKKLTELKRPERNVRIHTEKQIQEFRKSIEMFGQIRPIVIDEENTILAGNGLYETLLQMGREDAECYQYTDLTPNQKKKLMIADNKIYSLGIENLSILNELFEELRDDLDIPGYDEEILRTMIADAEEVTEQISSFGVLAQEEVQSIKASGERKEQKLAAAKAEVREQENTAECERQQAPELVQRPETQEDHFIICPDCGNKIWL